jgi:serine-aspartate repeat-containing protein C/D/E
VAVPTNLSTEVHVCEDHDETFLLTDLLQAANYTPSGAVRIMQLSILNPDGTSTPAPTALVQKLPDGSGFVVTASALANWNGNFNTLSLVFEVGGLPYNIAVKVVVDPVNDAPEGADKAIAVADGSGYVLKESDFGFTDAVELHGFKSVRITTVPTAGQLQLNGVVLAAGAEVPLADITAGRLKFVPQAGNGGDASFTFQVRDDGGTVGCDAADLDATANTLSFLMPSTSSLGDRVWNDLNRNGVQDAGESGVGGVSVMLMGAGKDGAWGTADDVLRTTTTLADGSYLFTGLNAGQYQVIFGGKAGYEYTTANVGDDAADSDANASGSTGTYTLDHNQAELSVDAGLRLIDTHTASLGDRVWFDANRNGLQDATEVGVSGVTVTLWSAGADGVFATADDVRTSTTTNSSGNYLFSGLSAGRYAVQVTAKSGYEFTTMGVNTLSGNDSDVNASGTSWAYSLAPGQTNLTVDAGLVDGKRASLGDRVWIDANDNGVQDSGEASLAGVTVRLLNASGQVIATQLTDASGNYLFTGLAAGQYAVQVVAPNGYKFTTANAGTNDASDSDTVWDGAGTQTGTTGLITLQIGESNRTVDAGVKVCLVKIGDKVWLDADADGVQDAGETGVAGVAMTLTGTGADGVFGTADDTVRTTTTDANGNYLFGDVAWGQYKVGMAMPNGLALTTAKVGSNDAVDSDFLATTVAAGSNLIVNGSFESATTGWTGLGDSVEVVQAAWSWFGVTGATGTYVAELDANLAGGGTGFYQDVQTEAGRVYQLSLDVAARTGTSLATNTVEVWWGNTRIASIDPTSTTLRTYTFSVVGNGAPVRLAFREEMCDDDTLGGIIDNVRLSAAATTTYSAAVNVNSCDDNLTVDAGVVVKDTNTACLGDRVWYDTNRDGAQNSNETGVSGVAVTLAGAGADGLFGTADDISRSTATNSTGYYSFTGLAAGQYQVTFGGKTGYRFTTSNVGSDATDSDANTSTGKSHVVTLGIGESNQTVDAGLQLIGDAMTAAIGDRVWHDDPANASGSYAAGYANGIQNTAEPYGLAGIRVSLYQSATSGGGGTLVATMVTDSNGYYRFNNLSAGWYQVEFDKGGLRNTSSPISANQLLDTWSWSAKDQGGNDQLDSDVTSGNIAKVRTNVFYLNEGQVDLTRDAGLTPIVIDLDGDGIQTVARGASDATFDLFGNGSAIHSGWISSSDGFLAVDRDGNGKIDDITELFGGIAKGAGFAQLASFDSNGDGVVDAHDAGFDKLRIWQDANGNHQTDAGELMTLAEAGVAAMTVGYTELPFLDKQGNLHLERSEATMADGRSVDMTDVYFNVDVSDANAAGVALPTMAELLGVDNVLLDQALGGGAMNAQPALADFGFDGASEAQRAILAAMKHVDPSMAVAC